MPECLVVCSNAKETTKSLAQALQPYMGDRIQILDGNKDGTQINYALSLSRTVEITEGTVEPDVPIVVPAGVILRGAGKYLTIISNPNQLKNGTVIADGHRCSVQDLAIGGDGNDGEIGFRVNSGIESKWVAQRILVTGSGGHNYFIDENADVGLKDCENAYCSRSGSNNYCAFHAWKPERVYIDGMFSHDNAQNGIGTWTYETSSIVIKDLVSEREGQSVIKLFRGHSNQRVLAATYIIQNPQWSRWRGMGLDGSALGSDPEFPWTPIKVIGGSMVDGHDNAIDTRASRGLTVIGTYIARIGQLDEYGTEYRGEGNGLTNLNEATILGVTAEFCNRSGYTLWQNHGTLVQGCVFRNNNQQKYMASNAQQTNSGITALASNQDCYDNRLLNNSCFDDQATSPSRIIATPQVRQYKVEIEHPERFFKGQCVKITDNNSEEYNYVDYVDGSTVGLRNKLKYSYTGTATLQGVATQEHGIRVHEGNAEAYRFTIRDNYTWGNVSEGIEIEGKDHKISGNNEYSDSEPSSSSEGGADDGNIKPGEIRTFYQDIFNPDQNEVVSIKNPYGEQVALMSEVLYIYKRANNSKAYIDAGIGTGSQGDYANVFYELSLYSATGLMLSTKFGQAKPHVWGKNQYLTHTIKGASGKGLISRAYVKVMGLI